MRGGCRCLLARAKNVGKRENFSPKSNLFYLGFLAVKTVFAAPRFFSKSLPLCLRESYFRLFNHREAYYEPILFFARFVFSALCLCNSGEWLRPSSAGTGLQTGSRPGRERRRVGADPAGAGRQDAGSSQSDAERLRHRSRAPATAAR